MQCVMLDPAAATVEYCRRARRIRASFNRSPSMRQHALGHLASQRNAQLKSIPVLVAAHNIDAGSTPAIERGFAAHSLERLQPFGFSFSDRIELLNAAERIGISRFRGNMILALHEHRVRGIPTKEATQTFQSGSPSFLLVLTIEILVVGIIAVACMW